jgi:mono/diheme cytochrome c family protein
MSTRRAARHSLSAWFAFVLIAAFALVGCTVRPQRPAVDNLLTPAPTPAEVSQSEAPPAPPHVTNGAQIYARKCQACHGEAGKGDGPRAEQVKSQGGQVINLVDPARQRSAKPADWFDVVTNGRIERLMPGFAASLTPQDRWDLLAYIWAMGTTTETLRAGQALYTRQCESCHGPQGKGDGPKAAGAKMADFTDPVYMAANSLTDIAAAMVKGDAHREVELDDSQRLQAAEYVRTFGYQYADPGTLRQSAFAGDGVLQFHVENLTPGGSPVKDLPVTLRAYDTQGEVFSRTATLDARGVVTFTQLPRSDGYFYQPDILYNGAKFFAQPRQISGTAVQTGTLPVYEVTTDASAITISEYHYFVQQVGEGVASVVEFYIFDNNSDRAYVDKSSPGGQLRSLKITVPEDASNIRFDGPGIGARFSQDGTTLYDSDAVPPGQRSSTIALIYEIPYRAGRQIERVMPYPVTTWDVLLPEGELRVSGLVDKGVKTMDNGSSIHQYAPEQPTVPAGGTISFDLVGQLRGAPVPGDDGRALGFGLVSIALAGGLAYFLFTRLRRVRALDAELAHDREALLEEIADLDNRFAEGKLKEAPYRKKRTQLKEQLRRIWE